MKTKMLKCHRCGDILTENELMTHSYKPAFLQDKPVCYPCTGILNREALDKYGDDIKRDLVQENMDYVAEQRSKWGACQ